MSPIVNITRNLGSTFAWQNANWWADSTRRASILARFWSRVNREKAKGCWPFTGYIATHGYGHFQFTEDGIHYRERAHRFVWFIRHGDIPAGMEICHRCDNPACVNPDHLFLGTHQQNCLDSIHKGRKRTWGLQKLNAEQVRAIRRRVVQGELQRVIASDFGIAHNTVSQIANRQTWAHLSDSDDVVSPC